MIRAKLKPSLLGERDDRKANALASCLRGRIPPPPPRCEMPRQSAKSLEL
jgi:hypothetical protein